MRLGKPFLTNRPASALAGALLLASTAFPAGGPPRILPDFPVQDPADPSAYQSNPVSASNGSVFLVVWTESLDSNRIKAARVRASDGALLDPGGIPVAHFQSYQALPKVASNGRDFLIVWEDLRGATGSDIRGAWVTGTADAEPQVQVVDLIEAEGEQMFPAVASSGDGFLVAWEDVSSSRSEIRAARMAPGAAAQPPLGFLVQGGAFGKFQPGVASTGAGYLVAWEDARSGESDIYARRVDAAGTSPLDEDAFPVSGAAGGQINLAVASNGRDYLVAWEDYRSGLSADIYVARVRGADGSVLDPAGAALASGDAWQVFPAVASSGGDYLVAWEDYAALGGGMDDLVGGRFGSDGIPMETGLVFARPAGSQFLPALASVEGRYLLAWQDMVADDAFRIRAQFSEFDEDGDGDAVPDRGDNCPQAPNPDQRDTDGDGQGDACDPDDDGDGAADAADNCPLGPNPGQEDADGDGSGDLCDPDDDNDQAEDGADNCPLSGNPGQEDADGDGAGDACDPDDDGDGAPDAADNCPLGPNPGQEDADGDGRGDACDADDDGDGVADASDNCPLSPNPGQRDSDGDGQGDACDADDDNDGAADASDNCPLAPNPDQADRDQDGLGNVCDTDDDGDGAADGHDNCPLAANASQLDRDGDGRGDACDPFLEVAIDVAPGDPENWLPMGMGQTVLVAVLGTARFDISQIAPATVRFAGATPRTNDGGPISVRDVNGDGLPDMVFRFRNDELDLDRTDTRASLAGGLKDGMPFGGTDAVRVSR